MMFEIYKNGFKVSNKIQLNNFILRIRSIAEYYIRFLISKSKIYLPVNIDIKDASIDLIAELFTVENDTLVRFKDFFESNFTSGEIKNENDFEKYLRGFIYTVIQNNLQNFYKENDPVTYHIYRNIKEAVKNLGLNTSIHFSDKYIHVGDSIGENIPDREDLTDLIHSHGIVKHILNLNKFIGSLFKILEDETKFYPAIRMQDLAQTIKSILAQEYINMNGAFTAPEHVSGKLNVKFMLDDVKFRYKEILNRYVIKNNLSKNFSESMYNVIEEIIADIGNGNERKSVMELMKKHFDDNDKLVFNKVQYCVDLFEEEIVKLIKKEKY